MRLTPAGSLTLVVLAFASPLPRPCLAADQADSSTTYAEGQCQQKETGIDNHDGDEGSSGVGQQQETRFEDDADADADADVDCRLYLAESLIPGGGIGMFTSVDIEEGERVGSGDLLIPVPIRDDWILWYYNWNSASLDERLGYEISAKAVAHVFCPGFGSQANCHFGLNNIHHVSHPKYDSAGLHRGVDPGAGAFTYWHDAGYEALRDIKAGDELFTSYGSPSWFDDAVEEVFVPSEWDYKKADEILNDAQNLIGVVEKVEAEAAWERILSKQTPGVRSVLPTGVKDLEVARTVGSARFSLGGDRSGARSREWLEENGMCIDWLYIKKSDIPQAGRGAFTRRSLAKGSVISPLPVLQTSRRHYLLEGDGNSTSGNKQLLLLNYAYSDKDSDIMLVPYTVLVNFINHGGQRANAGIRWSESPLHRREYLELNETQLLKQGPGLLMEIVALRDISADEEILLHYGKEWEDAWQRHVEKWSPPDDAEAYLYAEDVMRKHSHVGILTEEEQKLNPYPENVRTSCYFAHTYNTQYDEIPSEEASKEEENKFTLYRAIWKEEYNNDCLRQCRILSRFEERGDIFYNVELLYQREGISDGCVIAELENDERIFVDNIPIHAVMLVDKDRDHTLPNSFRHHIALPEVIFPAAWKRNARTEEGIVDNG